MVCDMLSGGDGGSVVKKGVYIPGCFTTLFYSAVFSLLNKLPQISNEDAFRLSYCEQYNHLALIIYTGNSIFYRLFTRRIDNFVVRVNYEPVFQTFGRYFSRSFCLTGT